MTWVTRLFARLLDYIWFFSLGLFALDFFNVDLFYYFLTIISLPVLFIPIEALLIKFFKTTLGKIVFGIRYSNRLSFKESFFIAAKKGILIEPLFLPIVNIFYLVIYLKELKKYKTKRWDDISTKTLIQKLPRRLPYSLILTLAVVISTICFIPDFTFNQIAKIFHIEKSIKYNAQEGLSFSRSDWVKVSSEELTFSVLFPKEPAYEEKKYDVPKSDRILTYKEYTHAENLQYSLGFVELPRSWTRWGSGIVFKSSIKLLAKTGTIANKKKSTHMNFPSLEYEIKHAEGKAYGKLILVKNTLYRIETKHQSNPTDEEKEVARQFFKSFIPKKS